MSNYIVTTNIFVTTSFTGLHHWPDAPEAVGYLRSLHRHVFGVRVEVSAEHNDREVEYHLFKTAIEGIIGGYGLGKKLEQNPAMSCEMMADFILDNLRATYGDRWFYKVEVNEDGENGSIVTAERQGLKSG